MSRVVKPYFLEGDPCLSAGQATSKGVIKTYQKVIEVFQTVEGQSVPRLRKVFNKTGFDLMDTKSVHLTVCGPADARVSQPLDIYRVGSSNSIIKTIQFQQLNHGVMRARATDNAAAAYRNSRSELIPQLYDAQLSLVGNLNFYPGYVFILRPTIVGMGEASQSRIFATLGLSGQYKATHIQHKIGLEGFTTKIIKSYNYGAALGESA
jgi:hypothetical protein